MQSKEFLFIYPKKYKKVRFTANIWWNEIFLWFIYTICVIIILKIHDMIYNYIFSSFQI